MNFVLGVIYSLVSLFVSAYIMLDLWSWFAVPLHAPIINYAQSLGLMIFINFIVIKAYATTGNKSNKQIWTQAFAKELVTLQIWGIGYLVQLWM